MNLAKGLIHTIFNNKLWHSVIDQPLVKQTHCASIHLDFCAELFVNPHWVQDIERTRKCVWLFSHTIFYLVLWPLHVTEFVQTGAMRIDSSHLIFVHTRGLTLTLFRPWPNTCIKHRLIIPDMCAESFVNPTRGVKHIERARVCLT